MCERNFTLQLIYMRSKAIKIDPKSITRDAFTWLMYLMLGYYSYLLNGLGPIMPFLRAELGMSYTVNSLHFSAFAGGMLIAGLSGDRLARRYGRRRTFWAGAFGMSGGVLFLLLGTHSVFTIIGTFLMGTIGSLLLVMIPASLSDRYGSQRAVALSESNVIGSLCAGIAPIIVGVLVSLHWGWRGAFIIGILSIFLLWGRFRRESFPEIQTTTPSSLTPIKLPGIYWIYWGLLVMGVSVEFCIIFWSTTFLEVVRGVPRANAALMMSLFLAAMMLGRWLGSWLASRIRSEEIVLGSVGVCLGGFLLHWWIPLVSFSMMGLFLAGLGVANLYPQILALAVGSAEHQTNLASARASLASGLAILLLPLLLGGLADLAGLWYAYGIVVILLVLIGSGGFMARSTSPIQPFALEPHRTK